PRGATMRMMLRIGLVGAIIVGAALAAAVVATAPDLTRPGRLASARSSTPPASDPTGADRASPRDEGVPGPPVPLFSDGFVDDSRYSLALYYTAPIADRGSLEDVFAACRGRSERGIADLRAKLDRLPANPSGSPGLALGRNRLEMLIGLLFLYDG